MLKKKILKISTRAEVVEEGAKVSQNYHAVIVLMWNLWNVMRVSAIVKACFSRFLWELQHGRSLSHYWAVLKNRPWHDLWLQLPIVTSVSSQFTKSPPSTKLSAARAHWLAVPMWIRDWVFTTFVQTTYTGCFRYISCTAVASCLCFNSFTT